MSKTYLPVLLVGSILALLMPREWTGKLISIVQIIVPFQDVATSGADLLDHALEADPLKVSGEAYEALEREKAGLQHQAATLALRVAELEKQVEILTATRLWDVDGRRIGTRGRLIPARVVTRDLLPWRSSRLVNVGSLQGVRSGSAVTSRAFNIDRGKTAGIGGGMPVLIRETLIGMVEQVGTHTARVKLLSDISVGMKVRIGRFTDEAFVPLDPYFWLTGRGGGAMEIRDVDRRDVEAGTIQAGDTVLSDPMSGMLPAAMTIGKIAAIKPDRNNPLLCILTVESAVDETSLRLVYVYNPETTMNEGPATAP